MSTRAGHLLFKPVSRLAATGFVGVLCLCALASLSGGALAQDSAVPNSAAETHQAVTAERSASVSGMVVDQSGALMGGARVSLLDADGHSLSDVIVDPHGEFSFAQLPAGAFHVTVTADGFSTASTEFRLQDRQSLVLPQITLAAEKLVTTIQVNAKNEALATEQIHEAEKQRVFGLVPNYYTSFNYDAVALTTGQKYSLAFHETFDPIRFAGVGVVAGIEQANNAFAGYGQGAAGYGKRYAAAYGDGLFTDLLSHAVFPSLFHQDPRYFYQGTGTVKSRFVHAVAFSVIIRTDNSGSAPNYSYLLGGLGAGALSNLYYPHANRGAGLVFTNAAIGIAGRAAGTVVREFLLGYLTTHKAGTGKPPDAAP